MLGWRGRGALAVLAFVGGCTQRRYEGPPLAAEQVATINVGTALVREIDGEKRRGGAFDFGRFEVTPGPHVLTLVFEVPKQTIGLRDIPRQAGEGTCVLSFTAQPGKDYYLGSRPRGDITTGRWNGAWEAWVRDPTLDTAEDQVARCASQPAAEVVRAPTAAPTSLVAAEQRPPAPTAVSPMPAAPAASAPPSAPAASTGVAEPVRSTPPVAPAPTATPAAATIRLGEWNLRSLGRDRGKDLARIAAVIDAHFDILVLIEVWQVGGAHPGYDALLDALGPTWAGLISDSARPNTTADGAEFYAIVYRRDLVRPCADWNALRDASGSSTTNLGASFLRPPAFGCFETAGAGGAAFDFLLAAYHARSAEGDAAEVAAEVTHLDDVFTAMQLARPGESDLIIAGDFNLESVELPPAIHALDRTRGEGSVLNLLGNRTASLPDHVLIYDARATAELFGDAEAVDVRGLVASNADFYRTVSDHLPIVIRLRAFRPDHD
jgi:Endonuclease/Exonuclease/phosphatase family